jgi:molybdopterin-guanine dinucleotide biosynthesis protein A
VLVIHDNGEAGPLGGIVALLRAMHGDALFVLGVDLARMTPQVARRIVGAAPFDGSRGVIPRHARGLEPHAALFTRAIAPIGEAQLAARRDLSLHTLI